MIISIVTVVYNSSNTIQATFESIISQTFDNYEYIVIDGNSTDCTLDIIKKYQDKITYWLTEPDKGIYDAMNKALKHVKGDYVLFMGADDIFLNRDALNDFMSNSDLRPDTINYGNVIFSNTKKIYDGHFGKFKLATRNICQQAILYPKSVFSERVFDLKYRIKADHEFNLYLYGNKKFRFNYVDQTLAIFNVEGTSGTRNDDDFENEKPFIVRRYLGTIPFIYIYLRKFLSTFFRFNK
jgi:glycosyltransferase involved in cell wall biosynthesis